MKIRKNGYTVIGMEKLRKVYRFLKEKYKLLALKKYTTLAGTLVFFLIMSIVPLSFWSTLLLGKLPIDAERVFSLPVFASVKNVLTYVQTEAQNATTGASLVLLLTTLYSSTTLFYQMRKSGEIIYGHPRPKKGLRLRLTALLLLLVVMGLLFTFAIVFAVGTFLFSRFLSPRWEVFADYALLILLSFALVLLLNAYVCPYKARLRSFLGGTAITVLAWVVAVIGFSVYLQISNLDKLYGALSAIIVFLLWLYILMICFIAGVIFNSEKLAAERKANKRKKRAHTA
ncbi:MAG: YihY/virulence factor BrkB family protein [Clostridia bacterium]|nr:YihY/virulence factor BrkB family protein [Clostridia bacterium]